MLIGRTFLFTSSLDFNMSHNLSYVCACVWDLSKLVVALWHLCFHCALRGSSVRETCFGTSEEESILCSPSNTWCLFSFPDSSCSAVSSTEQRPDVENKVSVIWCWSRGWDGRKKAKPLVTTVPQRTQDKEGTFTTKVRGSGHTHINNELADRSRFVFS